ncbi:MAG TPA: hypothetical protein V6D26_05250 [Stenomitos sp.]
MSENGENWGFTLKQSKFDYFFGRVQSNPRNQRRALQNLADLRQLGIDEAAGGRERLLQIFQDGLNAPETGRYFSEYGITITRRVELSGGAIEVKYFYPNSDLSSTPEVVTIIPKIYRQESD